VNVALVGAIGGRPAGLEFPVVDFDVAQVTTFRPGIEVMKSASPTELGQPGPVTYTYKVANTGDVPLADVSERITDDTCSPVKYVSGDTDRDGLLDTSKSIFEDRADELWTFTCTTTVSRDTVNTVKVTGSPSGPEGQPLCGPDAEPFLVQTSCDVGDQDRAKVVVTGTGGPGTGGGGPPEGGTNAGGGPPMAQTGGPSWLGPALLLGMLLVAVGGGLVAVSSARRSRWAANTSPPGGGAERLTVG